MSEELGYTCLCGKFHEAGIWGAAHWDMALSHTCDACNRENLIRRGKILKSKEKKNVKKKRDSTK